jgi:CelD/BcsL family acetyltransferase involved in cellulose biosynthesis
VGLLIAESGGRLLFLLPVVPARSRFRGVALPQLRSWVHDYCYLGTPLLSGHHDPDRIWAAVRSELRRVGRAPLLVMQLHSSDGPVAAALRRADAQEGLGVRQAPVTFRGFVHRRSAQTYATEWIARRHLANLARRRRHLSQALGTGIDTVDRTAVALDEAIEEFLRLEGSGWKGRAGTALLCRPGHDQFFREVCRGFAEEGRLMFLGLQAGTQVLALSAALKGGCGLFGFKKAYDETFARWSPGTLLDLEVLAWFHEQHLRWLDTCSSPDDMAGGLFRDRRPIRTLLLPVSAAGSVAASTISTSLLAHGYLRSTAPSLLRRHRDRRRRG